VSVVRTDDYSFGILQSGLHWAWFTAKCSTLTARFRYTSDTVFDTFPWPQSPTLAQVKAVAEASVSLRALRREIMTANRQRPTAGHCATSIAASKPPAPTASATPKPPSTHPRSAQYRRARRKQILITN